MTRLVDRAAGALARRLDRRNFLSRAAMVGTAAVAAPLEFGLKPKSAYAAVCNCSGSACGCGALCCDGWTEFCCTLNGVNRCPAGTVTGGWWKVDGSQFCGGGPRYYLDCNAQCGGCSCGGNGICSGACSGTRCGCAQGNCNNRKTGCTRFRYGQCHQDIRCLGPIVCRVVTCVPPWIFDPSCSTASRTSEATRYHNRPCLQEPYGAVDAITDVGGGLRVQGWAIDPSPDGRPALIDVFVGLKKVVTTTADLSRPDIDRAYPGAEGTKGFSVQFPYPEGNHLVCVYARDPATGRGKFLSVSNALVLCSLGNIDAITLIGPERIRVRGWAVAFHRIKSPATVRVWVDGREAARAPAGFRRDDVAASLRGVGPNHGFIIDLNVPRGRHQICLDVIYPSGYSKRIECGSIDVPAPPPTTTTTTTSTTTTTTSTTTIPVGGLR